MDETITQNGFWISGACGIWWIPEIYAQNIQHNIPAKNTLCGLPVIGMKAKSKSVDYSVSRRERRAKPKRG